MAEVDPDQEAALRRLRAAFGFVQVLRIIDHHDGQDHHDDETIEEAEHSQSERLTDVAKTLRSTWFVAGDGVGRSSTRNDSGGPYLS